LKYIFFINIVRFQIMFLSIFYNFFYKDCYYQFHLFEKILFLKIRFSFLSFFLLLLLFLGIIFIIAFVLDLSWRYSLSCIQFLFYFLFRSMRKNDRFLILISSQYYIHRNILMDSIFSLFDFFIFKINYHHILYVFL